MKRPTGPAQGIDRKILKRIRGFGRGAVVTPRHFVDLAGRQTIGSALARLVAAGRLRRVARGLYGLSSPAGLGPRWPSVEAVVKAVAARDRVRVQATGAYAANQLGLSPQIPMRIVFLTDGPNREIRLGKLTISFKRTTPRNMATAGRTSGLVIQALRWLGKDHVDDQVVEKLRTSLDPDSRVRLLADVPHAPAWVGDVMRRVAADDVG
jgi:hypothetical protein